jgi:threonine/homoserine/homoserine lactone efflux protein
LNSLEEFLLWFALIFPLVFSAGPGNVLCALCGANNGFKNSLPFILGLNFSYTTYSLLIGFGLGSVLDSFPRVFFVIQLLGVVYIFWLGYKFLIRKVLSSLCIHSF